MRGKFSWYRTNSQLFIKIKYFAKLLCLFSVNLLEVEL